MNSVNNNSHKGELERKLCETIRVKGYSVNAERTYVRWYRQYVKFHQLQHPERLGCEDITRFLTHLAVNRGVSPNTQNQALNALIFLYRHVLDITVEGIDAQRAKTPKRLPTVLSQEEVAALLGAMSGRGLLQARMLYGCGLRLNECLGLRVKDVDLSGKLIWVRAGKGNKDRCIELPESLVPLLSDQISFARSLHDKDREEMSPGVALPYAFAQKSPRAGESWEWFWLFIALSRSRALCYLTLLGCEHYRAVAVLPTNYLPIHEAESFADIMSMKMDSPKQFEPLRNAAE